MTLSNWIELCILIAIIISGSIIKCRSKKAVSDIDGANGVVRKVDLKGTTLGKYDMK